MVRSIRDARSQEQVYILDEMCKVFSKKVAAAFHVFAGKANSLSGFISEFISEIIWGGP